MTEFLCRRQQLCLVFSGFRKLFTEHFFQVIFPNKSFVGVRRYDKAAGNRNAGSSHFAQIGALSSGSHHIFFFYFLKIKYGIHYRTSHFICLCYVIRFKALRILQCYVITNGALQKGFEYFIKILRVKLLGIAKQDGAGGNYIDKSLHVHVLYGIVFYPVSCQFI